MRREGGYDFNISTSFPEASLVAAKRAPAEKRGNQGCITVPPTNEPTPALLSKSAGKIYV